MSVSYYVANAPPNTIPGGVYGPTYQRPGLFQRTVGSRTWRWPKSWWFYICTFGIGLALFLSIIAFLVVYLNYVNSNGAPLVAAPVVAVPFANTQVNEEDNTAAAQQGTTPTQDTPTDDAIKLLETKIEALEKLLSTTTTSSETNKDSLKSVQDKLTALEQKQTSSLTSSSVLTINGEAPFLLPASIGSNPVGLKLLNGDAEVVAGGLTVKGISASQTGFYSPSDVRIKKNITRRLEIDSLSSILSLNPVSYDYDKKWVEQTAREHTHEIGLIAQQVAKIYPNSITHRPMKFPNGTIIKDFNYITERSIIADLVGSIHALSTHISHLDSIISTLTNTSDTQKKKNVEL